MKKCECILLVDDDEINNFISQAIIERLGFCNKIIKACHGLQALELITGNFNKENCCPEIILLDLTMPIMDAFEFLQSFNKLQFANKQDVKIIILTTSNNPKDIENLREFGVFGFVHKPLTEDKMINILPQYFLNSAASN
jgi:CheY-like chemotaxis protein